MKFDFTRKRDKGYVLAFVGVMLIPLLAFTSFSVDLGAWYAKAAEIQQAADAASLGGAAFLPDVNRATVEAKNLAKRNGFDDADQNTTVTVSVPPEDPKRISVTIRLSGSSVPNYFSGVFGNSEQYLQRMSTAEYLPAPRMGSPRNYLGTGYCPLGNSNTATTPALNVTNGPFSFADNEANCAHPELAENWWLSHSYACNERTSGDRYLSYMDGTNNGITAVSAVNNSTKICNTTQAYSFDYFPNGTNEPNPRNVVPQSLHFARNPEYREDGYYFGITLKAPPGTAKTYSLEGFSMGTGSAGDGQCVNGPAILPNAADPIIESRYPASIFDASATTQWTLIDNGSFDPRVTTVSSGYQPAGWANQTTGRALNPPTTTANNCNLFSGWYNFPQTLSVPAGSEKTYWLQVKPPVYTQQTHANKLVANYRTQNVFSLRVKEGSTFSPCTSSPNDPIAQSSLVNGVDPYCPQIYGVEDLPVLTTFNFTSPSASRDFYFAELLSRYSNRTISMEVFDVDPFTTSLEIIKPDGSQQEFLPMVLCRTGMPASGNTEGACDDYSQQGVGPIPEAAPRRLDSSGQIVYEESATTRFNTFRGPSPLPKNLGSGCIPFYVSCPNKTWFDATGNVRINNGSFSADTALPTSGNGLLGLSNRTLRMSFVRGSDETANGWWRIRFNTTNQFSTRPTDRQTWSLKVSGEPVRLVPSNF
jgi:hypothetical protein